MERMLAVNYSFEINIVTHDPVPAYVRQTNNTHVIDTVLVPNDYADFSRNSYGQQTMNSVLKDQGHSHVDLLRLASTSNNVQIWEILHFMTQDNLLLNVKQLHLAVYIGKDCSHREFVSFWVFSRVLFFLGGGMPTKEKIS